ncbi:SHOCT domain-containing protein [Actinoplanes sp. N902-109]|uniref:SHOCT domain-containing protein n=1 Tax=Actinoplanes sp. (strain N902-109) TaxID=649831 RepID=UPI0003295AFD|nr:SHOCT domain-containing protein [Actinoplanes sp. N902-109]AGL18434.1 hypothetical protein L083_4924 [Actinoplanes sp. N902-109]
MPGEDPRDDQIVAAYAEGDDVQLIAARFGSTPAEIERIVAVATQPPPVPSWPDLPQHRPDLPQHPPDPAGAVRFNPPPGWPPAPDGWLPPAGWRPDPSWPPPPPGWPLYRTEPPPRPADPIDQLRRLGELRDLGILTDDEFAAKKAELLGRL